MTPSDFLKKQFGIKTTFRKSIVTISSINTNYSLVPADPSRLGLIVTCLPGKTPVITDNATDITSGLFQLSGYVDFKIDFLNAGTLLMKDLYVYDITNSLYNIYITEILSIN